MKRAKKNGLTENLQEEVRRREKPQLLELWEKIKKRKAPGPPEKAFEFLILRSFEIENADVVWPYDLKVGKKIVE